MPRHANIRILGWFLLVLCACQHNMVKTNTAIRNHVAAGRYDQALTTLRTSKHDAFKEQDRLLYWMNEGMLLHLLGEHQASIAVLEKAENLSRILYTRSMSKAIKAAFTSDAATDYQGEDHEKVLLNVIKALNFLALHDLEGALVEARKINDKLAYLNAGYQIHKNVYAEDAFAHWLAGMLFEMEGSHDDARISFVKAMDVYETQFRQRYDVDAPSWLAEDLVRAALRSGETELAGAYRDRLEQQDLGRSLDTLATHGEVIVVHLNGQGPSKKDFSMKCWFHDSERWTCNHRPGGDMLEKIEIGPATGSTAITVAFPVLDTREPGPPALTLRVPGARATSEVALPINAIARQTLRDKTPRIFEKTVLRAIAKAASKKAARAAPRVAGNDSKGMKAAGWLAGTTTDVAMTATEEADKRAWTTLPARIDVARAFVPPGAHDIEISTPRGKTIVRLEIAAGERVFLSYPSMP
jgi:uncharacterized protein